MKIKVSELIVRYMERLGIEYIFGIPGAHILPVYDSLYDASIKAILTKHEQGAAFMAGGYSRVSGRISACIATAGPGATNMVTGIANAYADRQPILLITGEAPTAIFGKGGLQESSGEGGSIDQLSLFKGITRYNRIVERTDYLEQILNQTGKILLSPNSGPVLLSFPFNIQNEYVDAAILERLSYQPRPVVNYRESPELATLADLILQARHPVILAGYGAIRSGAKQIIGELSGLLAIPVASSLKAKGVINEQSPLSLGSLGVTSSGCAYRYIVDRADLVILLGAGYNERTSYHWDPKVLDGKKIVQIDKDPTQLEKVYRAEMAIEGDIRETLNGLLREIERRDPPTPPQEETLAYISTLKSSANCDYVLFHSGFSLIESFFRHLEQAFPREAMLFDDNIIFAQNFWNVSCENHYHPNSGVSSLGHAIPAAIGARFANRCPVFAVLGDGGFQMCCMEIMTAVNYRIPLNIILFNNGTMGLIRKNQHRQYQQRYISCDFSNPDFAALSQAFGINYLKVEAETDLERLFHQFDLRDSINLVEIMIDRDAFPNYSSKR